MKLEEGKSFGGYKILRLLNEGGMGAVYLALQESVDRKVALKILHETQMNERTIVRFKAEAKVLAMISHPNVVQVLDLREEQGAMFIVMELIEGTDLGRFYRKFGKIPEEQAVEYMRQSAEGLSAAHDKDVIHRDVKPTNLLLTKEGQIKVTDFGIAKLDYSDSSQTKAGSILGTPDYMAPEQISGGELADARSDIYGLAASFYHLISGQKPFTGHSYADVLVAHKTDDLIPLIERCPEVSQELSDLIDHCMTKAAGDRPQSMRAVLEQLNRLSAGQRRNRVSLTTDEAPVLEQHISELGLIEVLAESGRIDRESLIQALDLQLARSGEGHLESLEDVLRQKEWVHDKDWIEVNHHLQRLVRLGENKMAYAHLKDQGLVSESELAKLESFATDPAIMFVALLENRELLKPSQLDSFKLSLHNIKLRSIVKVLLHVAHDMGLIDREVFERLVTLNDKEPLGQNIVSQGRLSWADFHKVLDTQKRVAVRHLFDSETLARNIKFRDLRQCPKCGAEIFQDDEVCRQCKHMLVKRASDEDEVESFDAEELEIIDEPSDSTIDPEWYLKTKSGEAGPYSLRQLVRAVEQGKIKDFHQMRKGTSGEWLEAVRVPFVARALGTCFNCGNLRSKDAGPCKICGKSDQ